MLEKRSVAELDQKLDRGAQLHIFGNLRDVLVVQQLEQRVSLENQLRNRRLDQLSELLFEVFVQKEQNGFWLQGTDAHQYS